MHKGKPLTHEPLEKRRAVLPTAQSLRLAKRCESVGQSDAHFVKEHSLEGIVAKRAHQLKDGNPTSHPRFSWEVCAPAFVTDSKSDPETAVGGPADRERPSRSGLLSRSRRLVTASLGERVVEVRTGGQ